MSGLRLMVYDATCKGKLVGLSHAWQLGAGLYRTLDRLDASFGATSWSEALRWLGEHESSEPIAEIQFWGHGKWGGAKIDKETLDRESLDAGSSQRKLVDAVRERMTPSSLWWFRTCETFGAEPGHDFARAWTDHFGCDAAGHTFIISHWQSGLHRLRAGDAPSWSVEEGLREGTPAKPKRAYWSRAFAPNTISCLRNSIPDGY